jgi:adenylate cyclase
LEGIADPGGVCLSEDAYRQVRDRLKEGFIDLEEKELKNIARPVRAYAIKTGSANLTSTTLASKPEKAAPLPYRFCPSPISAATQSRSTSSMASQRD